MYVNVSQHNDLNLSIHIMKIVERRAMVECLGQANDDDAS